MRNILLFPDGKEEDFMYPPNRDIVVGEKLQLAMHDGSTQLLNIVDIVQEEKRILYKLEY